MENIEFRQHLIVPRILERYPIGFGESSNNSSGSVMKTSDGTEDLLNTVSRLHRVSEQDSAEKKFYPG